MTRRELARVLIEDVENSDPLVQLYVDRLMLRISQTPALLASLIKSSSFENQQGHVIQLNFGKLPPEVIGGLRGVVGPGNVKILKFAKNGEPHVGVEIIISPEELEKARKIANLGGVSK